MDAQAGWGSLWWKRECDNAGREWSKKSITSRAALRRSASDEETCAAATSQHTTAAHRHSSHNTTHQATTATREPEHTRAITQESSSPREMKEVG